MRRRNENLRGLACGTARNTQTYEKHVASVHLHRESIRYLIRESLRSFSGGDCEVVRSLAFPFLTQKSVSGCNTQPAGDVPSFTHARQLHLHTLIPRATERRVITGIQKLSVKLSETMAVSGCRCIALPTRRRHIQQGLLPLPSTSSAGAAPSSLCGTR